MKRLQEAFTLIELLVVISIIALLSSILLVSLNNARSKSRDTVRVANVSQVSKALELYYNDNNSYPIGTFYSGFDDGGYPQSNGKCWCQDASTGNGLEKALVGSGILAKLPHDPAETPGTGNFLADGKGRGFMYVSDGQGYVLGAFLEASQAAPPTQNTVGSCMAGGNYQVNSGTLNPSACPPLTGPPISQGGSGGDQGAVPVISGIGGSCRPGGAITINGTGFTSSNNTVTFVDSTSHNTATFVANSGDSTTLSGSNPSGAGFVRVLVTVTNSNGTSNGKYWDISPDLGLPCIRSY